VGTDLGYALLIGFGATRLTELWKEVALRWGILRQAAWWKAVVSIVVCAALVLLVQHRSWQTKVLIAAGASGIALLIHSLDTVLRHQRDKVVSEVLGNRRRR
jgi:hypothetical protein